MDKGSSNPSSSKDSSLLRGASQPRTTPSTSAQLGASFPSAGHPDLHDTALLAQFAAAIGTPSHAAGPSQSNNFNPMVPSGSYPFQHNPFANSGASQVAAQLPSFSALDFSWNNYPPYLRPHGTSQGSLPPLGDAQSPLNPGLSTPGHTTSETASVRTRSTRSPSVSTNATAQDPEAQTEAERHAIAEEKRRRNTAASARFRVKKKQRIINFERTVSDLSGRAGDLEKEAADLRRENGWLKEIIMLKGSRLAGIDIASHLAEGSQLSSSGGTVDATRNEEESSASSGEESEEERPKARSQRKGKSARK